jgi:predicted ester cyclase
MEIKNFMRQYLNAISGKPKTEEIMGKYVTDPVLKEHMRFFEKAYPAYELIAEDMVAEGNKVAVRAVIRGVHEGEFQGILPTGLEVSISVMLIYVVENDKIVDHWMVADEFALMQQIGLFK